MPEKGLKKTIESSGRKGTRAYVMRRKKERTKRLLDRIFQRLDRGDNRDEVAAYIVQLMLSSSLQARRTFFALLDDDMKRRVLVCRSRHKAKRNTLRPQSGRPPVQAIIWE